MPYKSPTTSISTIGSPVSPYSPGKESIAAFQSMPGISELPAHVPDPVPEQSGLRIRNVDGPYIAWRPEYAAGGDKEIIE